MAQLKDDCFAFGGALMPVDEATAILADRVTSVAGHETVPLADALGRVLAEDVSAPRDVPPHDNSAVDGYAVFFDDLILDAETRLPVGGRVAAGHPLGRDSQRGEAIRIFTGAPMPDGMDTVFMEEDCSVEGDTVRLPPGLKHGANRRHRGEDVQTGDIVVASGTRLRPQELGLAASVGRGTLSVFQPLRAAVFSTGDEVRDPSDDAPDGCIFDANRYTVLGMLKDLGCHVTDLGILSDDEDSMAVALATAAAEHDVLLTSGGVSAGEEDHVKAAVERNGQIDFWRLSIKPGRPIALGQVAGTAFVGLPGNPVAAMVTFMILARPLLLRLGGAAQLDAQRFPVQAGFDYKKKTGRREWVRARLERDNGQLAAQKYRAGGSGILTSMVFADGLVELPEERGDVKAGETVDFLPFNEVTR
ncbi:MAG: molybdopterin molybdotransferase MoeA [Rhodospirillaceae bacterium]|jgi:molybdopterin molybdotransferase|nr:molybdopterin molybdotransferase MoeA [Rhodospirillaceae bacterium]